MNKTVLFSGMVLLCSNMNAQQDPQYTQFIFNKQLYNPATTGFYGEHCATLLARTQYTAYTDQTYYLNDQANNRLALYGAKGAKTVTFSYGAPIPFKTRRNGLNSGGIGVSMYADETGYLKTTYYKADVAYRRKLKKSFLGFGTNIGAMQKQVDLNGLIYKDPLDPKIPAKVNTSSININTGLGIYYYAPNLHELTIGYAAQNLIGSAFTFGQINSLSQGLHQYVTISAEFNVSNTKLNTFVLLKSGQQTTIFNNSINQSGTISLFNPDMTTGLLVDILPRFQVGGGVRASVNNIESINGMICFYATSNLKLGYAYDLNTSKLRSNNNNTHEVLLKYCFMKDQLLHVRDPRHLDRIKVFDRLFGEY